MKIRLMNMVKIVNEKTNKVVVLDKIKKEGWEGLTFPGGKRKENESLIESAIREAKEETGLDVSNLKYCGLISWESQDFTDVGFLYETTDFSGELIRDNREGKLSWINYDDFKTMEKMSLSMDKILAIYEGKYQEIYWDLLNDKIKYF